MYASVVCIRSIINFAHRIVTTLYYVGHRIVAFIFYILLALL